MLQHSIVAILSVGIKYILVAGGAFLLFYVWKTNAFTYRKLQNRVPKFADYRRELAYSVLSVLIMAMLACLTLTVLVPYNQVYFDRHQFSMTYYFASIILMILLHDTYFYWMHRAVHSPRLFKLIHLIHHRSTNPSPLAAYAFHPLEAFLEGFIVVLITFLFPVHWSAVMLFSSISIFHDVYIHLGYELIPRRFQQSRIGQCFNTSLYHNDHHRYFEGNYGLYFTFWDRLMGTLRSDPASQSANVAVTRKSPGELKE